MVGFSRFAPVSQNRFLKYSLVLQTGYYNVHLYHTYQRTNWDYLESKLFFFIHFVYDTY